MKNFVKVFFAAAVLLAAAVTTSAVPAQPGTFKYKQPDGTVIELRRHGDEFFNWTTRVSDGTVVELGADGFYRPGILDFAVRDAARRMRRQVNEKRIAGMGKRTHNQDPMTHGQHHIPVFLVEFADLGFSISDPKTSFDNLLNQQGYSANGATGSVRDFYYDNSHGAYEPVFDIYGPVTLSQNMAYYGQDNAAGTADLGYAAYAVAEAAKKLDSQIDFSNYDYDSDGEVDMILMYYAGYNEAEHGPKESIWPHQWYVNMMTNVTLDGKRLSRYFCTSELRGSSGTTMCGIGTTSHEFGHSLGLPDFYDTDYEENGQSGALYDFSLMCGGCYNNNGRTPPYFNSEERIILGWLMDDEVPELPDGNVTLTSVKDDYSYRSYTDTEGEYFLYECRDGSGWDAYLPTGLVVYHVDKSTIRNVGGFTPYYLWTASNSINAFGDHPCFYAVPSYDQTSLDFPYAMKYIVYPGASNVKTYSPVDWNGAPTGTTLSGINYSGGKVSFNVTANVNRTLAGYVRDGKADPIAGAVVTVSKPSQAPGLQRRVIPRAPESVTATTDADGFFSIDMESFDGDVAHVSVSKSGYMTVSKDVTLGSRGARVNITLYAENDGSEAWIQYYDENADGYVFGTSSFMCTMKIPAGELAAFAGRKIDKVKTAIAGESVQDAYVIAEAGGTRLLNHKIDNPVFNTNIVIDLSADNLMVPEGEDLYIGLAVRNSSTDYPIYVYVGGGNCHYASYSLKGNTQWTQLNGYDMFFSVHIEGSGTTVDPYEKYENIAAQGYNVIYPGDSFTHKAGDEFQLRLFEASGNNKPASIEWLYDGNAVSGQSVKLTKGSHKITAKLVLTDGRKEEVDLEITTQ